MKNTLSGSNSSLKHSNIRHAVASIKVIVFAMGNVNLALRMETIYRVLKQAPVYGVRPDGMGIAHLEDREITVLDLHRRFFASKGSYLIVVQNSEGELYGIPVAVVPTLMEVPLSSIHVLPKSYRHADLLDIATHVCHIPREEALLTIFLLDVDQLLPAS